MTIPKNAGLSHLADVASAIEYYPVKRRGQKRSLFPNYAAIEWLESSENDFDDTEVEFVTAMDGTGSELNVTFAFGRGTKSYPRPMFQIIPRDAFSGMGQAVTPCSCDRFDLSWDATRCEAHAEVEWDWERKAWKRPGADAPRAYYSPEPAAPTSDAGQSILERLYSQIQAVSEGRCECGLCRASRGDAPRIDGCLNFDANTQAIERRRQYEAQMNLYRQGPDAMTRWALGDEPAQDPNFEREGYRYSFTQDRWLPEVPPSAYPPGSVQLDVSQVLPELIQQAEQRMSDRLSQIMGQTITGTFRLEVNGETLQGIQSFSIEVEPNDETRR